MPVIDKKLSNHFSGKDVVPDKLCESGWYDQGSENYHFGMPRKSGLWLKHFLPAEESCHTVWLFLLLEMDRNNQIMQIQTAIHHVFNDGSFEELSLPLFPPDREIAISELSKVIG